MKINLYYSPAALNDLTDIKEYISFELFDPDAALKTVKKIIITNDKLTDFPDMGAQLSSISDIESDYRFLLSGNYISFYRHIDNTVYIDRILYARCDYLNILFDSNLNPHKLI